MQNRSQEHVESSKKSTALMVAMRHRGWGYRNPESVNRFVATVLSFFGIKPEGQEEQQVNESEEKSNTYGNNR